MSAANWISGAVRGKRQARVDRKLRRREPIPFLDSAPDANGCYGWPRACAHHDDLDCMEAEDACGHVYVYTNFAGERVGPYRCTQPMGHDQAHGDGKVGWWDAAS